MADILNNYTSSCPVPDNINPLSPNGFRFSVDKLPEVTFFCQQVNIPEISLGAPEMATPLNPQPLPGDQMEWSPLQIQFIVDEGMKNYKAIYNWITGLAFPVDREQFNTFMRTQRSMADQSTLSKMYSNGVLQVLDSSNNPAATIQLVDVIPVSLSGLTFESTATDVVYLIGNATFRIASFKFD